MRIRSLIFLLVLVLGTLPRLARAEEREEVNPIPPGIELLGRISQASGFSFVAIGKKIRGAIPIGLSPKPGPDGFRLVATATGSLLEEIDGIWVFRDVPWESGAIPFPSLPGASESERVTMDFREVSLDAVLHFIAKRASLRIEPERGDKTPVSCRFFGVPCRAVLQVIAKAAGYGCRIEGQWFMYGVDPLPPASGKKGKEDSCNRQPETAK